MITVAKFTDLMEAQVVKNRLEAEGIAVYMSGAESSGLFAGLTDLMEAQVVKNRLEAEGIAVYMSGAESSGLFAGLGGALGLVTLSVSEQDEEKACALLEAWQGPEEDVAEPEPEELPSGGTSIKAADWARPDSPASTEEGVKEPGHVRERTAARAQLPADYTEADAEEFEEEAAITLGAEDYATRAWKAAVIATLLSVAGCLFLTPFIYLYSAWWLLQLFQAKEELSRSGMRKLYGALIIDGIAFSFFILVAVFFGMAVIRNML